MRRAPRRPARPSLWAALAGSFAAGLLCTSFAVAGFTSLTSSSGSVTTKRIFLGARTTAAWDFWDNSNGGGGADKSDVLGSVDGLYDATVNWAKTFSSSRYYDFDLLGAAPAGVAVSAATFDFTYASDDGGTACFYFEVRRASDNALLGTHGSTSSTLGCVTGTTMQTFSTSIASEVASTDTANDLRIRVYMNQSGAHKTRMDAGTVSLTTAVGTETLSDLQSTDAADGSPATIVWSLGTAGDSVFYVSTNNWQSSFSSSRWLRFTFPADHVPSGATVTAVTFNHTYASNSSGNTTSVYYEVYSGATLIGSHGSSGSPYSSASSTSFVTDNVSLSEVTTPAVANGLIVKAYFKNSGSKKSNHDLASLSVSYYVD